MNIALLGWSKLPMGASLGGGYNLVAQQHALFLKKQGHHVHYLRSGQDFDLRRRIRYEGTWNNINLHSLVNSRNWAPADRNGSHCSLQIRDDKQDALVLDWIKKQAIEKVYIHSLEGQSFSLLKKLHEKGIHTSVFCHDYYFLCPRVSFLYRGRIPCVDNRGGGRCTDCLPVERFYPLRVFLKELMGRRRKQKPKRVNYQDSGTADEKVSNQALLGEMKKGWSDSPWGLRTRMGIDGISCADQVFAPSQFLVNMLIAAGLPKRKVQVVKIGLKHLDELKNSPVAEGPKDGMVHFAFHGGGQYHKGASLLLKAIEQLPLDIRNRAQFHLWGVELEKSIPGIKTYAAYGVEELLSHSSLYHVGILAHLWFENSPVAMLEHLSLGKPVITPRLGGVEDYIREGENGWFFEPGNSSALSKLIERIVCDKERLFVDKNVVNSSDEFFRSLDYSR